MSIDTSLVETLNRWGEHHRSFVRACSNDLVYAVILLAVLWFLVRILKSHPIHEGWRNFVKNLIIKGVVVFAIPAGIAIAISESISTIYVRQRPFIVDSNVTLLVPHSADGGMPSHHIVFMVTLVASIYFYQKGFATLLTALTLVTGIARVVAGIHYPSDILVGAVLGVVIVYLYRWFVPAKSLNLS
jgi:membrane-associated phospholipid phosphatase